MNEDKPVIEVGYGLGSSYDDGIEMNRKLTGELKEAIYQHELRHRNRNYNKADFLNDFNAQNSHFKAMLLFAFKNPEAIVGFFPFMYSYYYKQLTFNASAVPPFLWFSAIFSGFWWLIFKVNILEAFVCFLLLVLLMNGVALGVTHYLVKKSGYDY